MLRAPRCFVFLTTGFASKINGVVTKRVVTLSGAQRSRKVSGMEEIPAGGISFAGLGMTILPLQVFGAPPLLCLFDQQLKLGEAVALALPIASLVYAIYHIRTAAVELK